MNLLPSGTAKCRHKCCAAPVSTELGLSAQTATQKSQTPTLVLAPWRAILRKLQSCEIVWSFGFIKPCCPVLAQNQPHGEADLEFWVKNTRWAGLSTLCGFTETYIVLWSSYCHTAKVKDLESRLLYRKGETKHRHTHTHTHRDVLTISKHEDRATRGQYQMQTYHEHHASEPKHRQPLCWWKEWVAWSLSCEQVCTGEGRRKRTFQL